jgi:hypothetical protein
MGRDPCLAPREQVAGEEPRGEATIEERKRKEMVVSRSREPAEMGGSAPKSDRHTTAES